MAVYCITNITQSTAKAGNLITYYFDNNKETEDTSSVECVRWRQSALHTLAHVVLTPLMEAPVGNGGTEELTKFSQVTQLVGAKVRTQPQAARAQGYALNPRSAVSSNPYKEGWLK